MVEPLRNGFQGVNGSVSRKADEVDEGVYTQQSLSVKSTEANSKPQVGANKGFE